MSKPASKTTRTQPDPLAAPHRFIRLMLGLICFVAGAAVMIVEISANRLLAPNFGNSLHTWTALIGVILIAFSAGGYLGGYWADKFGRMTLLGWLLAGAAVLTMLTPNDHRRLADYRRLHPPAIAQRQAKLVSRSESSLRLQREPSPQ